MSFHSSTASRDYLTLPSLEYLLNLVVIHAYRFIRTVDKFSLVHSGMFLIFSIFLLVQFLSHVRPFLKIVIILDLCSILNFSKNNN